MSNVKEIRDADFMNEVLDAESPVLVDFFATWCPPCQRQLPVLDQLARDYQGKVKIVKVNTDKEQEWARRLSVRSIPTLVFYQNGKLVAKGSGFIPYKQLAQAFEVMLDTSAA